MLSSNPAQTAPAPPFFALRFPLSRAQAFAAHLTLSLLAFSALVLVMLRWWYPGELFLVDGGWEGLKLVAMVDLVLGPLLTLILYKPGKPNLAMDMSLIAAVQIGALAYGAVTTWQQRTVAVVYAERAFTTLSASDERDAASTLRAKEVEPQGIDALVVGSDQERRAVPLLLIPDPGADGFGQYLADLFNDFPELYARSDKYTVIADDDSRLAEHALTLDDLGTGAQRAAVERALAKRSNGTGPIALHRFKARYADGIALYDTAEARIVDYVPKAPDDAPGKAAAALPADPEENAGSSLER